ncbi:FecR family protein [Mucilaginibacter sp. OK098]|uniref:FecR family protein n=1 Tax=Mucilaginibacter sp. OK098 TaxID=1855297 RepID=UPI00091BD370|nr:FecR family protein [Mucilaginibacter sp. OK098]SHM79652.1 FecR family protein [Mucilaginibacter sp. OK098]
MKQRMSEDILIKYLLGEGGPAEALEVEAWAAANNANAKKLEEVKIILETSKRLAQDSPLGEVEAWEKFKDKRTAAKNEPARVIPFTANTNWLRIAAAVIFLIGGGWIGYYLYSGQKGTSADWVNLKATNSVRIDTLPDGSIVHINKNSAISYSGNFKSKREIRLTGEAFFNVKHNEAAPFTVHVNDISIIDVGTAFNVKSRLHNTEVIVESGIVKVSKNNNAVQLKAQQMVNIKLGDKAFKIEQTPDELYNYYVSNTFFANKTPLWRLIAVLNEAYGADIKIKNNVLRNTPITIPIRLQDSLTDILNLIKETTPEMHIDKSGGNIIIK